MKTDSVRAVTVCVVMRTIVGASLLVTPNTPGSTSSRFREVANAAFRVFPRIVLRNVFVVFVLDRTLTIRGIAFYRPAWFVVS